MRHSGSLLRHLAVALWLCLAAGSAAAHDTWFAPQPAERPGESLLALGTGNQFPVQEIAVSEAHLRRSGCRDEQAQAVTLSPARDAPTALILSVDAQAAATTALTCWAQLVAFDIEIAPPIVQLYLDEIHAPASVREAWARMHARGRPWKERYTKHARIELYDLRAGAAPAAAPQSVEMDMDVLLEVATQPIRPGDALAFQVLRDGAPLPGFAVQLRGDRSPVGLWQQTDAQGWARFRAPLPGRWVLRGTDLRLSEREADAWDSRFVTLAFEVAAADQNGSSLKLNKRSDSHTPATPTIAAEPPPNTSR